VADKKKEYSFRCMRCLGGRISVPRGEQTARCPLCGQGWRITWVTPEVAKIRGRIPKEEIANDTGSDN
jgi:DNA-directed RNA polymerase subunit RPC12/RpoP